jgi:alkylation response protein AidB-like acyl-CoA dehydrogenase
MDLELTDEQRWLGESVETLLEREWVPAESVDTTDPARRRRVWQQLVAFGALSVGDGIGAVEACLIARALGAHLVAVPFLGSAAVRLAAAGALEIEPDTAVAIALLEPGAAWSMAQPSTALEATDGGYSLSGEKVAIEQLDLSEQMAVVAAHDGQPALALLPARAVGARVVPRESFDSTLPMSAATFGGVRVDEVAVLPGIAGGEALERLLTSGSLLASAEAVGAAGRILDEACRYASERRQFGRPIGSFQALRHLLADMYVRTASGWSTVLYAAAAFDDGAPDAARTASIAKAYVSRGAREVAHGAMQVFGGIAFTAEHPAHRWLRRIIVREQQFGDAAHHERSLGRALARRGVDALAAGSHR